jgi:hypothetical protein
MTALAHHEARTLFERAWSHAVREGLVDAARREALLVEGTRGMRRIAGVLGTESLLEDLERAMRAMLGLVDLHLHAVSDGDVPAAARSIAERGLLFHTKGASQAIKRVLAIEHGESPEALDAATLRRFDEEVVGHWARMPYAEFADRARGAEERRRRVDAARALCDLIEGADPDPWHEPEQVVTTALMVLAWSPRRTWPADVKAFERLLAAARAAPARLAALPPGVPAAHVPIVERIRAEHAPRLERLLADATLPLHRLVGGDPLSNPLHDLAVVPDTALDALDALGAETTAHWTALTGGRSDDAHLLLAMLAGTVAPGLKPPLGVREAESLLRSAPLRQPTEAALRAWLDANAPHAYHEGLVELWTTFWEALEDLGDGASSEAVKAFAREWLPVRAAARGARQAVR